MCRPASFIVTKNRVLWSKNSDSHEEIIEQNHLNDSTRGGDFVRVEITPKDFDFRLPIERWEYRVDQDTTPDWYDPREAEIAVRAELPAWYAVHFISSGEITEGMSRVVLSGEVTQSGGECEANGSATVTQSGGVCRAYGSSTVTQSGGECEANGSSTVTQSGGECWAYESSTVTQSGGGCWAHDSAAVTQSGGECYAYGSATVTQSGGECWAYGSAAVTQSGGECLAYDSATVIKKE